MPKAYEIIGIGVVGMIILIVCWYSLSQPISVQTITFEEPKQLTVSIADKAKQEELKKQIADLEKQRADIAADEIKRLKDIADEKKKIEDAEKERLRIESEPFYKYSHVGCYKDTSDRAMPNMVSALTIKECAALSKSKGYHYFGLQDPQGQPKPDVAQCLYGDDINYKKHGNSSDCIKGPSGDYLGGVWGNSIYKWN